MSNSVATKVTPIVYHFKAFAADKEGHKKLQALVAANKLTMDDIEVVAATSDAPEKWKRKSVTVEAPLPVIAIEGFTPEQNAHVEYLIGKQVEAKNKEYVDTLTGEWAHWDAILQLPPIMRTAAVKVSAEQIAAVTAVLVEWMNESGFPAPAVQLTEGLCTKKFSATECRKVKLPVLEKVQTIIGDWFETMTGEDADAETVEVLKPVVDLWNDAINKVLNPEQSAVTEDMFDL